MSIHRLPARAKAEETKEDDRISSAAAAPSPAWIPGRMYAISFDLNTAEAERHHPTGSSTGAYKLIEHVFEQHGFKRMQGSLYVGGKETNSVDCVLVVQALAKRHPWIRFAVRDIRMLRVEESSDLLPALGRQAVLFEVASGL